MTLTNLTNIEGMLTQKLSEINSANSTQLPTLLSEYETLFHDYTGKGPHYSEKGVIITVPVIANWTTHEENIIDILNLNLDPFYVDFPVEVGLETKVQDLYVQKKPFLAFFSLPHPFSDPRSIVKLRQMQLFEWIETCSLDPTPPNCFYQLDPLVKILAKHLRTKSPETFELLQYFKYRSNFGFFFLSFFLFSFFINYK